MPRAKNTNRNKIKQFMITFPQWAPDQKVKILNLLENHFELAYYKIAQETHKDGGIHYHAIIKLVSGQTKMSVLKIFMDEYPRNYKRVDIKPVRSIKHEINIIKYLDKEDDNILEHPDGYVEARDPSKNKQRELNRLIWMYTGYDSYEEYLEKMPIFQAMKKARDEEWHERNFPSY